MGVDLNSFIRDPSFLAKKITLAKLSPSCVSSFVGVCCIYVCHVCCMTDIYIYLPIYLSLFLVSGFFRTGRYDIETLSACVF